MGSSKKHKKHKSERREKYEEYSNSMDPTHLQRGLKLILKVGSNSTPEYSADSPLAASNGPPTAAEAMLAAPNSPIVTDADHDEYRSERHKKSKKKKKKKDRDRDKDKDKNKDKDKDKEKDREKKHKHHKHKHRGDRRGSHQSDKQKDIMPNEKTDDREEKPVELSNETAFTNQRSPKSASAVNSAIIEGDSSQDGFSFMDDENSQPLPENILFYAGITTDNSPSSQPVSKPIVPRKVDELLLGSPASSIQSSSIGLGSGSPTKPLPDLLIPSPSASTPASTPGGACSLNALTPKGLEAPKTPSSSSESGREPRTCVLKLKQQKSPLNKLLDHLLRFLEKRDPHQFFAWPVTNDIAPGYSTIISKPMDFSTMRQKIDDGDYLTLTDFVDDFKLMCENAIKYNHVDTVYHKAAKRLMQVGMKHLSPDNLMRSLKPLSGFMRELTAKELGFELGQGDESSYDNQNLGDSADEGASTGGDEPTAAQLEEEEKRRTLRLENEPKSRFEPYVDDLTSEEILAQVQDAARNAKMLLSKREKAHKMGFLRQNKDGTTSLNILLREENEGPEKVISLGDLVGKLKTGTGQLQSMHEEKVNIAKLSKPLNYGPFTSFAPVFDSRFSNMGKEETQLVLDTYGDVTGSEYAESILEFTKDSDYASKLANGLLDVLTNGEHSKTMSELYDMQVQSYEEQEMQKCFANSYAFEKREIYEEFEKYKNTRIDFNRLRSLKELGIETDFLDSVEVEMKNFELNRRMQEHLSNNLNLIEKLRVTQHERLSQPLPAHLEHIAPPSQEEVHMAQQITQQLTDIAKKLPPSAIADTYSLRKAMGISYVGLPTPPQPIQRLAMPDLLQQPVSLPQVHLPPTVNTSSENTTITIPDDSVAMDIDEDVVGSNSGVDLENELREFLESGNGLNAADTSEENNIVAQLLMN